MVDTPKLESKIDSSGLKIGFLADEIGISRQSLHAKINNRTKFRTAETYVLTDLLKLTTEEKQAIFFANEVD